MKRIAALIAATLVAGCGGDLAGKGGMGGTMQAGGTGGGAAGAGGGGTSSPPGLPADVAALCDAPGGNEITFQDKTDAQAHLTGRWILCRPPGLSSATEQPDQGGIELGPDMSWYILHWVNGTLTRTDGFQASGAYMFPRPQALDYDPVRGADLSFGLAPEVVGVSMLDSPRKMRWTNNAIYLREADGS